MSVARPAIEPAAPASGPLSYEGWRACRFFTTFDGLRALAILAVIWHHSGGGPLDSTGLSRGFLGVDFFFAISGFLIVTLLLRERDRNGVISLRGFYMRRSLRIFPVYYAFLGGITAAYVLLQPGDPTTAEIVESAPWAALYLSNLVPISAGLLSLTWSLSTEEQFYLVWAPAEKWLGRVGVYLLLAAVVAASLALHLGWFDPLLLALYGEEHPGSGEPRLLPIFAATLLPMALGVALAHAMHGRRGFAAVQRVAGFPLAPLVWAAAFCVLVFAVPGDVRGWMRPTIQALMVLLLAALLLHDTGPLGRVLRWKPLARIGLVSYGMYLLHKPVTIVAEAAFGRLGIPGRVDGVLGTFLLTLVAAAGTWFVAELSFRYFETPFLKLKDRWATTRAGAADPR